MIVKILSASKSFSGVEYNDKKVEKGKGELMTMKNFPSFINENSSSQTVKDYLKSISKSNKVKKPQFHAVISTKFQEHSKEELKIIAENFMEEMGYGKQPYIAVFHNDTDNNHIHIVSTRVDKKSGKKLDDSFERLKSQKALQKVMDKLYPEQRLNEELDKLLNYKYGSLNQLKQLLERNGFKLSKNSEGDSRLDILKNGVLQRNLTGNQLSFSTNEDNNRKKQIRAIIKKYSKIYSNKAFKVIDDRKQKDLYEKETNAQPKIEWESELQNKLRDMFGIDIFFHHKGEQNPFGYTIIDNKSKSIFKGSEILKMKELFQFTDDKIDKKNFEVLKDFNITSEKEKEIVKNWYNKKHLHAPIQSHIVFFNNKNNVFDYRIQGREDVLNFIKSGKDKSDKIDVVNVDGKYYAIHTQLHQVWDMEKLIGEIQYPQNMDKGNAKQYGDDSIIENAIELSTDLLEDTSDVIGNILKPNYGARIEDEFDPRKKKRKKR